MEKLIKCKFCDNELSRNAYICPKCGGKQYSIIGKILMFIVCIALILWGLNGLIR